MKLVKIPFIALVLFLFVLSCKNTKDVEDRYVVMLSLDGFRWDYANMTETPNLDWIAENGVKAQSLQPSFPSKTFPNHYTLATGLVPDHHGIVQNSFYDPQSGEYYAISNRASVENGDFYQGEPIWNTAEKQGIKTASYYWVGSEADIQDMHPSYWKKYDHKFPFEQRIDSVIHWLSLPEMERPHLIVWYMHEPDKSGHVYGPESEETLTMVTYLDSLVGVYLRKIQALPIANQIDIIITSDHGMAAISEDKKVNLDDFINPEYIEIMEGYNPNFLFKAKTGFMDSLFNQLSEIPHLNVWKSGSVPAALNYGKHPRTLDIVVCAESGWSVVTENKKVGKGAHGYDHQIRDMHAIFYAIGPHFKKGYQAKTFSNTDIYSLIAHLLEIEPAETDGSLDNVLDMLQKSN